MTRQGIKASSTPNQDSHFYSPSPYACYFGVADGHGPSGHHVSDYISRALPAIVEQGLIRQRGSL